jgi:hypothetical protein
MSQQRPWCGSSYLNSMRRSRASFRPSRGMWRSFAISNRSRLEHGSIPSISGPRRDSGFVSGRWSDCALPSAICRNSTNASAPEMPLILAKKSIASPFSPVAKSIHLCLSSLTEKPGERSSRNGDRQELPGSPRRLNIRHRTGIVNLAFASSMRLRGVVVWAALNFYLPF